MPFAGKRFILPSVLACQTGDIFGKNFKTKALNLGKGAFPDSFFPCFRPAIGTLTQSGNGKLLL
jgi:hypothetical protein